MRFVQLKYFFVALMLFFGQASHAVSSPIVMLDATAKKITQELHRNRGRLKSNPGIAYNIVKRILIPHVDVTGMSRSVVGRAAWSQASAKERQQFTQEFVNLVIRTYSGALTEYTNETVKFHPIRGGYEGKRYVRVDSIIVRKNAKNIPLSYSLVLKGSQWKIYDMSIEGVSLLQNFRSQFSSELSRGGLAQLTQKLTQHKRKRR